MPYRNIHLHPVLRLVYFILRTLGWLGVSVFYRRRIVLGEANFRFDGPAIVITNHPSTLLDVFNPGIQVRQEMFFLANYGLFRHPVSRWVFTQLFCIPVKRREDVAEGESRDNNAAFEQSFRHLEQNGVLFIAAEGTSWMNRWVREFKTGTARIAFGVEARNDWKKDVKIIPVGLTYSAPNLFRSDVVVHAGEPVYVREWSGDWQQNPEKAIETLTAELQRRVTALTVHTRDESGEQFIGRIETILDNSEPLPLQESFFRIKKIAETELDNEALLEKTTRYFENLQKEGLTDRGLRACTTSGAGVQALTDALGIVIGFIPFAIGYTCWFLPCFLPWLLNNRLHLYIGYSSTVKILAGLITFPLGLWMVYRLVSGLPGLEHSGPLALILMIALGFFAERYAEITRRFWERLKAWRFAANQHEAFDQLAALRNAILMQLNIGQEEAVY